MRPWLFVIALMTQAALLFSAPLPTASSQAMYAPQNQQSQVEFTDVAAFYTYGDEITFQAKITPFENIQNLFLFIQPEGQSARLQNVDLNEFGEALFSYDLVNSPLRPFAKITYWYRVVFTDGSEIESDNYSFDYIDNLHNWSSIETESLEIHWYEGGLEFGQAAMNAAEAGLTNASLYLPAQLVNKIDLYIYSTAADLQKALQLTQQYWVAGHASPELDVVLISVAPGADQSLELERQIPHELAHMLQYQMLGQNVHLLPPWLLEGTASLAETRPNPDYQRVLDIAVENDTLMPMTSLCEAFPPEASGAFQAYAQSASFTRYLYENHGTSGIENLMHAYADGMGCEEAVEKTLGEPLGVLDQKWRRESLGLDAGAVAFENLTPYLIILLILIAVPAATVILTRKK